MKKIILDTNFLIIPHKFKVDIFSEIDRICNFNYRICVFEQSISELKRIIDEQSGIDKKAAQFGLKLINVKDIEIIKSEPIGVDKLILGTAKSTIIATLDSKLRKELVKKGASVIILRQKKYLQLLEGKLYK